MLTLVLMLMLMFPGTEEICRAYPEPNRLLFFSVHLYDRVSHHSSLITRHSRVAAVSAGHSQPQSEHHLV